MLVLVYLFYLLVSLFLFLSIKPLVLGAGLLFNTFYLLFYYLGTIIFLKINGYNGLRSYYYLTIMGSYLVFFNMGYVIGRKKGGLTNFSYFIVKYKVERSVRVFLGLLVAVPFFLYGMQFFRYGIPVFSQNPEEIRKLNISGATFSFLSLTLFSPIFLLLGVAGKKTIEKILVMFFLLINILTAFKSAVARLLVIYLLYRKQTFNLKTGLFLLLIMFLMMFLITYLKFKTFGLDYAFYRFYMRLFYANPHDLWYVLSFFPEKYGFLWGKAFLMDFVSLKPGKDLSFDGWMYQEIYNTSDFAGINSSVGEVWADWSIGAFVIIFLWGYFIGNWDRMVLKKNLLPQERVLFSVMSLIFAASAANLYKCILVLFLPSIFMFFFLKVLSCMLEFSIRGGKK